MQPRLIVHDYKRQTYPNSLNGPGVERCCNSNATELQCRGLEVTPAAAEAFLLLEVTLAIAAGHPCCWKSRWSLLSPAD